LLLCVLDDAAECRLGLLLQAQRVPCSGQRMRDLYRLLREQRPEAERVLVGHEAILRHLWQLGVTQWSKRPVTWTTVRGWARWHGFPLTPGTRRGRNYMSALTTTYPITAWLLSRPYNGHPMRVFRAPPPRW
jgi:hypothetical protein